MIWDCPKTLIAHQKMKATNSTGNFPNNMVISMKSEYTSYGIYCNPSM